MPFVSIRFVEEVLDDTTGEKRDEIADKVTKVISEAAGITPDLVWVTFEPIPESDWYIGPDSVRKLRRENQS